VSRYPVRKSVLEPTLGPKELVLGNPEVVVSQVPARGARYSYTVHILAAVVAGILAEVSVGINLRRSVAVGGCSHGLDGLGRSISKVI